MELDAKQKKDLIENLIFDGYAAREFTYGSKEKPIIFKLRTLTQIEQEDSYAKINQYEDSIAKSIELKLSVLSYSLMAVNGILVTREHADNIIHKLPAQLIASLYDNYDELYKEQKHIIENNDLLKEIVKDNFNRVRYKVMRAAGALPTEQRVKEMSDIQFLWYYLNLQEDQQETAQIDKAKLDYLSWFINPDAAKLVQEKEESQAKTNAQGITKREVRSGNTITTYTDGIVNDNFERELSEIIGTEPLTQLDSSTQKGNMYESKDDFLARAAMVKKQLDMQNDQRHKELEQQQKKEQELTKIEEDAKKAGINPNNVDFFDFDE